MLDGEINRAFPVAALCQRRSFLLLPAHSAVVDRRYRIAKSQFNRALENKLGRAGKSDIGETFPVAAKIDI